LLGKDKEKEMRDVCQGTVKWFNEGKGYGFIARENEGDLFFHISSFQEERELADLLSVWFTVGANPRGPCAEKVWFHEPSLEEISPDVSQSSENQSPPPSFASIPNQEIAAKEEAANEPMICGGTVISWNERRGFGLIRTDAYGSVFAHFAQIMGKNRTALNAGEEVSFIARYNPSKNRWEAKQIGGPQREELRHSPPECLDPLICTLVFKSGGNIFASPDNGYAGPWPKIPVCLLSLPGNGAGFRGLKVSIILGKDGMVASAKMVA